MTPRLQIWGVEGIPEVEAGDDIGQLIVAAGADLAAGDVVVVTSKVVSKAEGRLVAGSRDDHLDAETARLVARRGDTRIVETRHGLVLAAAGIDASNVPAGMVALLPRDPDASARTIRASVRAAAGADVAVIVSDTMGRPWRDGVVDAAIGAAGLDVRWDLRGQHDAAGHLLEATVVAVADELAAAADLVKGKITSTPVAVIRGFPFTRSESADLGARALIRPAADDMFRLGSREAAERVVLESAPLAAAGEGRALTASETDGVRRAIAAVWPAVDGVAGDDVAVGAGVPSEAPGTEVTWDEATGTVTVRGTPVAAGVAAGRLLAALAAEELRGQLVEPPPDAAAALRVIAP
jgi:coenzyme F420-0:L-glutamate ligase/coenzyme F420-1:gamma-L-glutamate ligase